MTAKDGVRHTSWTLSTSADIKFVAALFAGLFVGTLAGGFLSDRFGRRAMFTWSLIWYVVANACMAMQTDAFWLNGWRCMAGIGIGAELVTIATYLSELTPAHLRGRAFACGQACGFVAVPLVALLAWLLVPHQPLGIDGWRWLVMLGCVGAVFIWWIRRELPESPRWLASHGALPRADVLVRALEQRVEAEFGQPLPPPSSLPPTASDLADQTQATHRLTRLLREPYRGRTILMVIFNIFQTIGYYGFASWLPSLLISQGVTVTTSLLYSAIIAVAAPFGPLAGLWIADRFERRSVMIACALVVLVTGMLFSQAHDMPPLILLGVVMTLASNMLSYSYHAYQAELFPTALRARAVSLVYSAGRFVAIFNAFMIGATLHTFGSPGVFALIGASMLIIAVALWLFGPLTANRAVDSI